MVIDGVGKEEGVIGLEVGGGERREVGVLAEQGVEGRGGDAGGGCGVEDLENAQAVDEEEGFGGG